MSVLEAKNVSIERGGRTILRDAGLRIEPGEFIAIVGPNGSGKSTLLRTLAGLWKSSREDGDVFLDERSLGFLTRRDIARRIAFVPQQTYTDFAFTVAEIVAMGRYPHRGRLSHQTPKDREAIEMALRHCDISDLTARAVNTLSGGERQRVLLARSLAVEPEFILLDEPTASLDIEHSLEILELCRQLAAMGRSVVLSTHDLNAVTRFASRVVLLNEGRIVASGTQEEVLRPAVLQEVFGVQAEIALTESGQPVYVFHRPPGQANSIPK